MVKKREGGKKSKRKAQPKYISNFDIADNVKANSTFWLFVLNTDRFDGVFFWGKEHDKFCMHSWIALADQSLILLFCRKKTLTENKNTPSWLVAEISDSAYLKSFYFSISMWMLGMWISQVFLSKDYIYITECKVLQYEICCSSLCLVAKFLPFLGS